MKQFNKYVFILRGIVIFSMVFMFMGCPRPKTETAYKPLFMKRSELEKSIRFEAAAELNNPAKIYYKDKLIFISESYKGIHIINNADPKNPVKMGFIRIVGCLDMAIKGSTIYVDNATDLVAIEADDPLKPFVSKRIVDAFPEPFPPDQLMIPVQYNKENRAPDLVLVDWIKK